MAEPAQTRRLALSTLSLSLLGAVGLWRFLTPRSARPLAEPVTVPLAEVPEGGALVLPEHGIAVVREGGRLLALDLTCTHLACTVSATPAGFVCPCHGSRFSSEGRRLDGPATGPLKRLAVEQRGDTLLVSRG
jgi:cytochrome b6-f complex iron-sulfur subunit